MSCSPIRCDADALLRAMMKRDLSVMTTASLTGISRDVISKLIRSNCAISLKTAKKLQEHFGDDVIIFEKEAKPMIQDLTNPQEKIYKQCTLPDLNSVVKAQEREDYKLTALERMTTGEILLTFERARN